MSDFFLGCISICLCIVMISFAYLMFFITTFDNSPFKNNNTSQAYTILEYAYMKVFVVLMPHDKYIVFKNFEDANDFVFNNVHVRGITESRFIESIEDLYK